MSNHAAGSFRVGSACVDITPQAGTHLAGSGAGEHRPAQSVLHPLFARAAIFEADGKRLCVLGLDLCIATEQFADAVRRAASERFALQPEAVMIHAVQTHSAPSVGPFMLDPDFPLELTPEDEYLCGSESPYVSLVVDRSLQAIERAVAELTPVQAGVGRAVRADLAFNRRGVMRNGSVCMPWVFTSRENPLGPTDIAYMEGPTDPEVGVFCARTSDMRNTCLLLHYTCHPVNVFGTRSTYHAVSADWPGCWAEGVRQGYGRETDSVILNGCCGNINPWPPFTADFRPDAERMGAELARTARQIVASLTFTDVDRVDYRSRTVPLPFRTVPPARLEAVERILAEHPEPKWLDEEPRRIDTTWFRAASTRSIEHCRRRTPELPYHVQAFRIGDAAVVALPGEPFVEGQLAIKVRSPAPFTFVAHATSQYVGYLPTREAYERGGHEANADCTYWAKMAPGSLETVVDAAVDMLHELFG